MATPSPFSQSHVCSYMAFLLKNNQISCIKNDKRADWRAKFNPWRGPNSKDMCYSVKNISTVGPPCFSLWSSSGSSCKVTLLLQRLKLCLCSHLHTPGITAWGWCWAVGFGKLQNFWTLFNHSKSTSVGACRPLYSPPAGSIVFLLISCVSLLEGHL